MNWLLSAVLCAATIGIASGGSLSSSANPKDASAPLSAKDVFKAPAETSSFANKTFEGKSFATKTFDPQTASLGNKTVESSASSFNKEFEAKTWTGPTANSSFDRTFPAKEAILPGAKGSPFEKNVILLGESSFALMGPPKNANRSIVMNAYAGPEADLMSKDLKKVSDTLGGLKDLPDRTLSIEEVKNLLNRDTKPGLPQTNKNSEPIAP
jgi:hypothetical protein